MIPAEAGEALQEILVLRRTAAGVPGGVQTVVLAVRHADDVPGVILRLGAVVGLAGDDTAVDARVIGQTVEQVGIALAHGLLLDGRGVGGVLRQVGGVAQVAVIVFDVGGDPVVDGLHLLVGGLAAEGQLGQDGVLDIVGQRGLLRGGGEPDGAGFGVTLECHRESNIRIIIPIINRRAVVSAVLPVQIVAGGAAAGDVLHGFVPDARNCLLNIRSGGQLHIQCHCLLSGYHLLAKRRDRFCFCEIIHCLCGDRGLCRRGSLERCFRDALPHAGIYRIGMRAHICRPRIGLRRRRGVRRQRLGRQQRQRQDQRQQQRGHALCHTFHVSPPLLVRLFYGVSLHRNLY